MRNGKLFLAMAFVSLGTIAVAAKYVAGPATGMNFNFLNTGPDTSKSCEPGAKPVQPLQSRLLQYADPAVRTASLADMSALRRQGTSWIRSIVWFSDKPGVPLSFDATDPANKSTANLALLGKDLRTKGFTDWVIAFGPQGRMSPTCLANGAYGACYDASEQAVAIEFIIHARRALDAGPHPRLWMDLSNEACPALPQANIISAINNQRQYLPALITAYAKAFPNDRFSVSCIGDRNVAARLDNIKAIFNAQGISPGYFDFHVYAKQNQNVLTNATAAGAWLKQNAKRFIIGETNIHRDDVMRSIIQGIEASNIQPLAVLYWPLRDSETVCGADSPERLN